MKFKLYILLVFVSTFIEVRAQDPVFTQFLIVPETDCGIPFASVYLNAIVFGNSAIKFPLSGKKSSFCVLAITGFEVLGGLPII